MCRVLPEDIELAFEVLGVKRTAPGGVTLAVVRAKDDEWLEDGWLFTRCRGTKDGAIGGNLTPAENAEAQLGGDLGENSLLLLKADGVVRFEKDVSDRILADLRQFAANFALGLTLEEEVRDASHDTRAIAVTAVGTCGTAVGHRAEKLASI